MKFYKKRKLFKQLSEKEWLQYIVGFFVAWAIAAVIIIGGSKIMNHIQLGWLNHLLEIVIIIFGLIVGGFIMSKTSPRSLKDF